MSSSKSSPSSAIIEGNDDLLIEILLFLPAKSLLTFKTVSKRWRSLISAPLFCRRRTLHHPVRRRETQTLLLIGARSEYVVCDPTIPKLYPFRLQFGLPSVDVMQSCNGLLLLRRCEEGEGCRYYVFNPTTMQKREVSPLPSKSYAGPFLMFDPYLSPHYRVVYFESTKKGNLVYLYKSESEEHEWEKLEGEAIQMEMSCSSGFYLNGGICFDSLACLSIFTPDDCKLTKIPDIPERGRPTEELCYGI